MGCFQSTDITELELKKHLKDVPHIYTKLQQHKMTKLIYFEHISGKDLDILCNEDGLNLSSIDRIKFKSIIRSLQLAHSDDASNKPFINSETVDTQTNNKTDESIEETNNIDKLEKDYKHKITTTVEIDEIIPAKNKNKSPNISDKLSDKVITTFCASQGWSFGRDHQQMLNEIGFKLSVPQGIIGIIESYIWTSAIVFSKTYPNILLSEFDFATKSTKFGINPRNPLNIIILGDKKVGKTNLVSRYYANAFIKVNEEEGLNTETTRAVIDLDLNLNNNNNELEIDNYENIKSKRLYLRLYDTVGFDNIDGMYKQGCIKEAHAIMIVFDVSNKKTYEWIKINEILNQLLDIKFGNIENALNDIDEIEMKRLPIIIVGAKIDEIDNNIDDSKRKGQHKLTKLSHIVDRVIEIEDIKNEYCIPYNAPYIEVSTKCCMNVEHLFQITVKEAMTYICNVRKQSQGY
eukprot:458177_1